LTNFWPANRTVLLSTPCSLAQAIKLPLNEMAPMMPPTTASDITTLLCSTAAPAALAKAARYSSTAAMAAAAPPPMPLYNAIICGMSVMATLRPLHHATSEPSTMAAMMSS
jgi:hypothetical protein